MKVTIIAIKKQHSINHSLSSTSIMEILCAMILLTLFRMDMQKKKPSPLPTGFSFVTKTFWL